jgi:hypothetical protein
MNVWEITLDEGMVFMEANFLRDIIRPVAQRLDIINTRFDAAKQRGADGEELSHWADEWGDAESFGESLAALTLVGTYHWIERWRKRRLREAGVKGKLPADAQALLALLAGKYDLSLVAAHEPVAETLRLFANAWKHDGDQASPSLAANLMMDPNLSYGLMDDERVRGALGTRAGLNARARIDEIVLAWVTLATQYVQALLGAPTK